MDKQIQQVSAALEGAASSLSAGLDTAAVPPNRIWLQPDPDREDATDICDATTWCQDSVGINDVEYVISSSGCDMAEDLRSTMRSEAMRISGFSIGLLQSVIGRLEGKE